MRATTIAALFAGIAVASARPATKGRPYKGRPDKFSGPGHNCRSREMWTEEKKTWCCENHSLGCKDADVATASAIKQPMSTGAVQSDDAVALKTLVGSLSDFALSAKTQKKLTKMINGLMRKLKNPTKQPKESKWKSKGTKLRSARDAPCAGLTGGTLVICNVKAENAAAKAAADQATIAERLAAKLLRADEKEQKALQRSADAAEQVLRKNAIKQSQKQKQDAKKAQKQNSKQAAKAAKAQKAQKQKAKKAQNAALREERKQKKLEAQQKKQAKQQKKQAAQQKQNQKTNEQKQQAKQQKQNQQKQNKQGNGGNGGNGGNNNNNNNNNNVGSSQQFKSD